MATRTKTREITITEDHGAFSIFRTKKLKKEEYDFYGMSALRQLLSNEKARIIHTIKTEKPNSIYELAKKLERSFKSVSDDIKLLERFGFIELIAERTGKRIKHKPIITANKVNIIVRI